MDANLATTNWMLGIMAAVSVLEAIVLVGVGIAAFVVYRRISELIAGLENRQIAPAMTRLNAILEDLKTVSATVKQETERVDHAIRTTMDRVDDTADRVRSNVRAKASWLVAVLRGLRVAIEEALRTDSRGAAPRGATERVM
jgi:hypothetical protein